MQKLLAEEMGRLSVEEFKKADKTPVIIVLDNIRSLNNIGSIFRTGDAFRIEAIYLCGICCTPPHREIHKTALGAEDSVAWKYFSNTQDAVGELKKGGYKVYAIEQTHNSVMLASEDFYSLTSNKIALVLGNEIEGVQEDVLAMCGGSIEIPQAGTKHSLNVSCAAAIVMWEFYKKMLPDNK